MNELAVSSVFCKLFDTTDENEKKIFDKKEDKEN